MTLGITSFLTDVSTEMIFSVLPVFVTRDLGAGTTVLGLIEGLADAVNNFSRAVSGFFSQRLRKRKSLVVLGYGLSTVVKPFFALARGWPDVLIVRVTDRVGKGVRTTPRDVLLADSVPQEKLGRAFGVHRSLDQSGAVVGPLLASLLLFVFPAIGFRGLFLISVIPGVLSVLVLSRWAIEIRGIAKQEGARRSFRQALNPGFATALAAISIFTLGAFSFSFIIVRSQQLSLSDALIPMVYLTINLAHTGIGFPSGRLSDMIGREAALLTGYGLFLATSLFGAVSTVSLMSVFGIAILFGLYQGIVETTQRALLPKFVRAEYRAQGFGVYYLVVAVASLIGNLMFGWLWQTQNPSTAFAYSSITSAISIGVFLVVISRAKRTRSTAAHTSNLSH